MNIFDVILGGIARIWQILGYHPIFLAIMLFACAAKIFLVVHISMHLRRNSNIYIRRSCILLILVLVGGILSDFSWSLIVIRAILFPALSHSFCLFSIRIAWAFAIVQYHAIALLIESLIEKKLFGIRQKILIGISSVFFVALIVLIVLSLTTHYAFQSHIEIFITKILSQYGLFPLILLSLAITISKLHTYDIPRLLKIQVKVFIKTTIVPFIILENAAYIYPLSIIRSYGDNKYAFSSLATIILVYSIFYCTRQVIGLRFLNFKSHVETATGSFPLINNFRVVLEQFGTVTNARELVHITKTFFEQSFNIYPHKTHLYLHLPTGQDEPPAQPDQREIMVEHFLELHHPSSESQPLFKSGEAFFLDDLAFDDFYNVNHKPDMLQLMYALDADIFIPIMDKEQLIAYIIIDRGSRANDTRGKNELYDETEHDYMIVFSDYLGNIISLLRDESFDQLLHQKKTLEEDVFLRHQEMNQYKESMQSFIKSSNGREIGIIFYKNSRFVLGNKCARDFIPIDLNLHSGHPITKQLKKIAQQIYEYKTPQTCLITGQDGEKMVVSGIPNLEHNNIIITLHHPEISDLLRKKTELLNDPQDWGFFLCLETTKMGNLVDQFIPGYGEVLLNFKVKLLKASLGKKAVLLDVCTDDLIPLVELIHSISLREHLHTVTLYEPVTSPELAIKIFGINSLLVTPSQERPLLEKLNHNGTLFIQNIHFLDLETQEYLAEFLRYGMYRKLKSDHKTHSDVRIICSTNKNIYSALQEGTFSKNLFEELQSTTLTMPSLATLATEDLSELVDVIVKQTTAHAHMGPLMCLTEREKQKLLNAHIPSLYELRSKIKNICVEKAKHETLNPETQEPPQLFQAAQTSVVDEELLEAVQLGRHALKDKRIMGILWKKFQNQNKIAMFLGVNRSSVNRRCKEHGFIE